MTLRIGSLFSGAGQLDRAVEQATGGVTVWQAEPDPACTTVLDKRFGVPNLGDVTLIDWHEVPPVEVLCGGFPCQDLSTAGKQAGITEGTRSGLWSYFADAIEIIRPQLVVIENVRGLLSAKATSSQGLPIRAMGRVLGDLADRGYDARWKVVSAASVGSCHKRERVIILATEASADGGR